MKHVNRKNFNNLFVLLANENLSLLKKEFDTIFGEDNMLNRLVEFGIDLLKTGFSAVESLLTNSN